MARKSNNLSKILQSIGVVGGAISQFEQAKLNKKEKAEADARQKITDTRNALRLEKEQQASDRQNQLLNLINTPKVEGTIPTIFQGQQSSGIDQLLKQDIALRDPITAFKMRQPKVIDPVKLPTNQLGRYAFFKAEKNKGKSLSDVHEIEFSELDKKFNPKKITKEQADKVLSKSKEKFMQDKINDSRDDLGIVPTFMMIKDWEAEYDRSQEAFNKFKKLEELKGKQGKSSSVKQRLLNKGYSKEEINEAMK